MATVGDPHFIPDLVPDSVSDSLSATQRCVSQLIEIVERYNLRANGDLLQALASLRKRTAARQLTVAVFSGSREDKSSLIETLLNTTLGTASIPPSTAACTYFSYGTRTECAVTLANSMTAWLPLEQLAAFVSEKVPASSLKKVLVRLPNAALENGLVVVDTPELTGDPEAFLSRTADAIAEADACVFVLTANEGLKENAIAFLRGMQGKLEKFFFLLDGTASLSVIERKRSLDLVKRSLEQRCGLLQPRVALLSAFSAEGTDAKLRKQRSQACQTKLLGFARMSRQSLTSNEVARVAEETLSQADGALTLRETAPLERVRLRRVVKALGGISRQAAGLALASDTAMRNLVELPKETDRPASVVDVSEVSGGERAPAPEQAAEKRAEATSELGDMSIGDGQAAARMPDRPRIRFSAACDAIPPVVQAPWGTLATTGRAPSFAATSIPSWLPLPSAALIPAPSLLLDQIPNDTTAPMRPEPAQRERERAEAFAPESPGEALAAALPGGREPQPAEVAPDRPVEVKPAARSFEWCANRFAFPGEDDEDEFASGGGRRLAWRFVGFAALLAALLVIAWAAVLVLRPQDAQAVSSRLSAARLTVMQASTARLARARVAAANLRMRLTQTSQRSSASPSTPASAGPPPVAVQSGGANSERVAPNADVPASHAETPPPQSTAHQAAAGAPVPAAPTASIADAKSARPAPGRPFAAAPPTGRAFQSGSQPGNAAFEGALGRWIEASRSGNIEAQAGCYAPVVATYFNSRNVTRRQVQLDKERTSAAMAGVQNYHITTIGISGATNGQRAVLLQKDWDTATGHGPGFAGTEIERLVFAPVEGHWMIVGEQEVKLPKVHGANAVKRRQHGDQRPL